MENCPVNIVNLTPHAIVVRDGETEHVFPPSGMVARLRTEIRPTLAIAGIHVVSTATVGVDGLPEPQQDTWYLVSSLVAQTVRRPDLLSPDTGPTAIRDAQGQIVAVRRFQQFV
jgi:hypothetical protein